MTSRPDDRQSAFGRVAALALACGLGIVMTNCDVLVPRQSWSRRWGPMVPHETFPGDCGICHSSESWKVLREDFAFDHAKETGTPLTGAHDRAACLRCHNDRGPVAAYVERGCGGCHVDPHKGSLGLPCTRCHNEDTWDPDGAILEHVRTRFALAGVHAITPCETCHQRATAGDFRGTPVECHLCHQRDAIRAFPNHAINGWIRDCERCHTPVAWTAPGFQHDAFPLIGGHAGVDCLQCHAGGRFAGTPPDCFSCHRQDYLAAPNHVAGGFSTDCTECHDTFAWK